MAYLKNHGDVSTEICRTIRTNSYRLEAVIAEEDLSERENGFGRRWSLTGQGVALEGS